MPNFVEEPEVFLKGLGQDTDIVSKVVKVSIGNVLCHIYLRREEACLET